MKKAKKRKKGSTAFVVTKAACTTRKEIAYQNKDITSKLLAEYFKGPGSWMGE